MEKFNHPGECQTLGVAKDIRDTYQQVGKLKTIGNDEKKAALHAEMQRVNQLPANSSYALHRIVFLRQELANLVLHVNIITPPGRHDVEQVPLNILGLPVRKVG